MSVPGKELGHFRSDAGLKQTCNVQVCTGWGKIPHRPAIGLHYITGM